MLEQAFRSHDGREFLDSLRNASSVEDFLSIIDKADAEQAGIDERLAADSGEEAADTNGENAAQAGGQEIQAQKRVQRRKRQPDRRS